MKVIGLDSGLASFGWVVAEYSSANGAPRFYRGGVLKTAPSKDVRKGLDASRRATFLFDALWKEFRSEDEVACIAVEALAFPAGKILWSVLSGLGRARGLVDALSVTLGVGIYEATPQELKKAVTGSTSASKEEVIARLVERHPEAGRMLETRPASQREHLADACAAVIACQAFSGDLLLRRERRASP